MSSNSDQRIDAAIAEYVAACDAGDPPNRAEFLARFPDLAESLTRFLADHERMRMLANNDATLSVRPNPDSASTVGLNSAAQTLGTVSYFGDYELLELIARGGMGVVYKARQVSLNRVVALKMILSGRFASPTDVIRFRQEASAAAGLDHPNVLPIYEVGDHDSQHYFTMKLVEGGTLAARIAELVSLPREGSRLMEQIARGVHYAHQRGVLHRDLKPSNVLLDGRDIPLITDFGLAKRTEGDSSLTQSGAIVGTPSYMAPEQARGEKAISTAADVYSLGAILYELLTGRPPFRGETIAQTLRQVEEQEPVAPRKLNPVADVDLEAIALKCLEKVTTRRYESAGVLADDLARWQRGEPVTARRAGSTARVWKWAKRNPAVAGMSGVLAIVLLGLAIGGPLVALRQAELKDTATHREADAREAARRADDSARTFARSLYGTQINLAHRSYQDGELARAMALLAKAPAELRGWEWAYLNRLCSAELRTLRDKSGGYASAAFSQDGKWAVTLNWKNLITIWDTSATTSIASWTADMNTEPAWRRVAISPDGRVVAVTNTHGDVTVHDAKTGNQRWTTRAHVHPDPHNTYNPVEALAFGADGQWLVTGGQDSHLRVWDAATGRERAVCRGHGNYVIAAVFTPDGKGVVSAGWDDTVRLWDSATGALRQTLPFARQESGGGTLTCVAMSPNGQVIAAGNDSGTVQLWDVGSGKVLHTLTAHILGPELAPQGVASLAFDATGDRLATGGGYRAVKVWEVKTGRRLWEYRGHNDQLLAVGLAAGGLLLSASRDGRIKVWDATADPEATAFPPPTERFGYMAMSRDGETVAELNGRKVELWNSASVKRRTSLELSNVAVGAVVSPSGNRIAVQCDKIIEIWDVTNARRLCSLPFKSQWILGLCAAFSPAGDRLVTGSGEAPVRVWDTTTGNMLLEIAAGHVNSLTVDPSGEWIATASGDGRVRVWNIETGKLLQTYEGHGDEGCWCVAFSPDGRRLASGGGDSIVRIWDAAEGAQLFALTGHRMAVEGLGFTAEGSRLASVGQDGTARVWDMESGYELLTLRADLGTPRIAFTGDGLRLVCASYEGVIIWHGRQ